MSMFSTAVFGANPVVTSTAVASVNQDSVYSYALGASDADGDGLNWSVASKPDWLDLNTTNTPASLMHVIDIDGERIC